MSVAITIAGLLLSGAVRPVYAQGHEQALSDAEVEKLRDTAYYPPERVLTFIEFLNLRTKEIDTLVTGKRQPGREQDIHDLMEQFTSIADDFDDNLDDRYNVSRKLALETLADIRETATKLIDEQKAWFLAHPPPKDGATKAPPKS
jgi:hypothetical protein